MSTSTSRGDSLAQGCILCQKNSRRIVVTSFCVGCVTVTEYVETTIGDSKLGADERVNVEVDGVARLMSSFSCRAFNFSRHMG